MFSIFVVMSVLSLVCGQGNVTSLKDKQKKRRNLFGNLFEDSFSVSREEEESGGNGYRFVPGLFTITKFPNDPCTGEPSGLLGVCVTSSECVDREGTVEGSCARGFGTCCVLHLNPEAGSINVVHNNTHVSNPTYPSPNTQASTFLYTFVRSSSSVCFIRLDFLDFVVSDPDVNSEAPYPSGATTMYGWRCLADQVTFSTSTMKIPTLCGHLTDHHLYLDSSTDNHNAMTITQTGTSDRVWRFRVSQIPCGTIYTPRQGCLQYYTGIVGKIKSFNFGEDGVKEGHHLIAQEYSICFRREKRYCKISYFPESETSFRVSGSPPTTKGRSGWTGCKKDYVTIPSGSSGDGLGCYGGGVATHNVDRFCGNRFNCRDTATTNSIIVSDVLPFRMGVFFSSTEPGGPLNGDNYNRGFSLNYQQLLC